MRKMLVLALLAMTLGALPVSAGVYCASFDPCINASGSSVNLAAPSSGTDLGATATPYKDLYLYGSGTFGTTYFRFTGTPTAARTVTIPNASFTIPQLEGDNAWSGTQTFGGAATHGFNSDIGLCLGNSCSGSTTLARIVHGSGQTPAAPGLQTGSLSNSWHVAERSDTGYNFLNGSCGSVACTDPSVIIHSHNQDTTQYRNLAAYGSAGKMVKTLTETTPTAFVRIPVAASTGTGGTIDFTIFAADATDQQTLSGTIQFSVVNKAGTEVCTTPTTEGTPISSLTAGTPIVCTLSCDTSPANAVDIQVSCTSSLTQTTLEAYWSINMVGPGEPIPQ